MGFIKGVCFPPSFILTYCFVYEKKEDGMRINVSAPVDKEILFKTAEEGNIKRLKEIIE